VPEWLVFVSSLQLEMPEAFPADTYGQFVDSGRALLLNPKGDAWSEFAGASNLIGWRFRATHEDLTAYLHSWDQTGSHCGFEELYARERWLFGMFSCGVSCIERATPHTRSQAMLQSWI
jgi:hypothetical protein